MKTTRELKTLSRALFFSGVFLVVVFFADWYSGSFFFNYKFRALRFILSVLIPALATVFNCFQEKALKFIENSMVIIMSFFVIGLFLSAMLKTNPYSINEIISIYHISYALVGVFTVFLTVTIISYNDKDIARHYESFYKSFFLGYVPMMITLYSLFYFYYRMTDSAYTVNFVPFSGEIKAVLSEFDTLTVMRTLGNIAFYSTISLTAARFAKKHQALWAFLFPFIVCVLTEAMQGIFSLGDADIDDIILNGTGALIGALIYKFLVEKIRRNSLCSE